MGRKPADAWACATPIQYHLGASTSKLRGYRFAGDMDSSTFFADKELERRNVKEDQVDRAMLADVFLETLAVCPQARQRFFRW